MPSVEVKRMQAILAVVWLIAIAVILIAAIQVLSLSLAVPIDVSDTIKNILSSISGL